MATNENESFAGKVAFVTGAGTGMGRAAALAFAREGANVVVADVSEQDNRETVRMIEEAGGRTLAVACDVRRSEDVKAALDGTVEAFGRLDFAFNNAGVVEAPTPTAEMDEAESDRVINTYLRGVFLCMTRDPPDARAGGRRDREHLLGCRRQDPGKGSAYEGNTPPQPDPGDPELGAAEGEPRGSGDRGVEHVQDLQDSTKVLDDRYTDSRFPALMIGIGLGKVPPIPGGALEF